MLTGSIMDFLFKSASFVGFLDRYGSVRLVNCLKASFEEGVFPYERYSDFLQDSEQGRVSRLGRIRNLGRKTIKEFFQLTQNYEAYEEGAAASEDRCHGSGLPQDGRKHEG